MSNSTPRAALPPQPSEQGPDELWLQLHGDCDPADLSEPVDYTKGDVTWCWHQINDSDVRYVRADLAAEQVEQIRRETVQACADLCRRIAETRDRMTLPSSAADQCADAILALLPVKEPKE